MKKDFKKYKLKVCLRGELSLQEWRSMGLFIAGLGGGARVLKILQNIWGACHLVFFF